MFSHVFVGVKSFDRAFGFYSRLMSVIEVEGRFVEAGRQWAGWHSAGGSRPLFVICKPHNGQPHDEGNGQTIGFSASTREMVDAAHEFAVRNGGNCEGAPGLRPWYHALFYGAYFRDPEGNKLCVVCHSGE